jgi:uncharacterized repeat protein (TIGR03803 family)
MRRNRFSLFVLVLALIIAFCSRPAKAQFSESLFYNFCSTGGADCTDGEEPTQGGQIIQAADGNLWGVTMAAGTAGNDEGWGTLYKISTAGKLTVIHSFCSQGSGACSDGGIPKGGLVQGPDGNIYGTTSFTGAAGGTVFKATPSGAFSTIYTFCVEGGSCANGSLPEGPLTVGSDGNLYGTTYFGGSGGGGTIYKLTLSGTLTTLHNFGTENDSSVPSGLVQGTDGNFYGTSALGGTNPSGGGQGTFYQMTPAGKYTTLYSFCQIYENGVCNDGNLPTRGSLVQNAAGQFIGTTVAGGIGTAGTLGAGTIFEVTSAGAESVLYSYCNTRDTDRGCTDGADPYNGGYIAGDGNFYTTTSVDGQFGEGTVSELGSPIYSFCEAGMPCTDGYLPFAAPIEDSEGNLYGTTQYGGTNPICYCGVIWKMTASPALPAPVQVTLNPTTVAPNSSTTLSWKALNAFSTTMQQCYANVQGGTAGAGTWTGKQAGSYSSSTKLLTGSASITPTKAGTYTYALTCGGIESGFATLTVSGTSKDTSTTTLTATPNPATVGQSVSLKATVTGSGATPTGSVTYDVTTIALGSANLSSGVATLTASSNGQAPGTYPIVANYGGSSTYDASASKAVTVTLNKAPTSTTLSANPTAVTPPGDVTLTATVKRSTSGATGVPTGTVSFTVEGITLDTVKVNGSGVATLTASSAGISAGSYPIKAVYNGDASDVTSTSTAVTVTVK